MGRSTELVGRADLLATASATLDGASRGAVFFVGEPGLGKTAIVNELAEQYSKKMTLIRIHGSASLSTVPYGVLAPYLSNLPIAETAGPITVLRALWEHFSSVSPDPERPRLLVADNAHDLDEPTAQIILELVSAGWAKLVAGTRTHPGVPRALLQLWYEGLADRIDLPPLDEEQAKELLERKLKGDVQEEAARLLWKVSEGNPLHLHCLTEVGQQERTMQRTDNGLWVLKGNIGNPGGKLIDVVRNLLQRRTKRERDALNLIALAEPAPMSMVEAVVGADVVRSLLDSELVVASEGPDAELRPRYPVYGEALRRLVPASRSLALRQKLVGKFDVEPSSVEGLLRMVSWSLECGLDVPDRQLLRAAVLASKLFDNELALMAAEAVQDPELRIAARAVMARAYYNAGEYVEAARLLDADFGKGNDATALTVGALLWSATQAALGATTEQIMAGADRLRTAGAALARTRPQDADVILARTTERARMIELLALSRSGQYEELIQRLDILESPADESQRSAQCRIFALVLRSEVLTIQGKAVTGLRLAGQAKELLQQEDEELFSFPEFVLVRYLSAAIAAGDWERADGAIGQYSAISSKGLISFGGGMGTARGLVLLRQGRRKDALKVLLPAVEALGANDSQQLLMLTTAMAFFAAAATDQSDLAHRLDAQFREQPIAKSLELYVEAYRAAGREYLDRNGQGAARLMGAARVAQAEGLALVEVINLALRLELGHDGVAERLGALLPQVEGPWLEGWCRLGAAIAANDAEDLLRAAACLEAVGLPEAAQLAYAKVSTLPDSGPRRGRAGGALPATLTAREQLIIQHARAGLSDRQIAEQLTISVRTVEGHLYRTYAKLGIRGREELIDLR